MTLGLTRFETELVAIDPGYTAVSPTSRLDSFLTCSLQLCRTQRREAPRALPTPTPLRHLFQPACDEAVRRDYNVRALYGRPLMLDVLLESYEEYLGRKPERRRHRIIDLA
jgi:hypothetical protein